jgi:hypothetical protein
MRFKSQESRLKIGRFCRGLEPWVAHREERQVKFGPVEDKSSSSLPYLPTDAAPPDDIFEHVLSPNTFVSHTRLLLWL